MLESFKEPITELTKIEQIQLTKLEKKLIKAKEETMGELETIVADLTAVSVKKLAGVNIKPTEVEKVIGDLNSTNSARKAA